MLTSKADRSGVPFGQRRGRKSGEADNDAAAVDEDEEEEDGEAATAGGGAGAEQEDEETDPTLLFKLEFKLEFKLDAALPATVVAIDALSEAASSIAPSTAAGASGKCLVPNRARCTNRIKCAASVSKVDSHGEVQLGLVDAASTICDSSTREKYNTRVRQREEGTAGVGEATDRAGTAGVAGSAAAPAAAAGVAFTV